MGRALLVAPSVSLPCKPAWGETMPMKLPVTTGKPNTAAAFADRLAAALKRRLHPGFTAKHVARARHVSEPTVWAWMNGINGPKGHHLVELLGLMDASFGNEILAPTGATLVKLADKRAALERAQAEYEEAMKIAGGAA